MAALDVESFKTEISTPRELALAAYDHSQALGHQPQPYQQEENFTEIHADPKGAAARWLARTRNRLSS
jgi:hypothetical protein